MISGEDSGPVICPLVLDDQPGLRFPLGSSEASLRTQKMLSVDSSLGVLAAPLTNFSPN